MRKTITYEIIFDKIVYSSIAHAIFVLTHPFFDYEQSWDGFNYSYISDSSRGIVSFDKQKHIVVGAMRNEAESRMIQYTNVPAIRFFKGAPKDVLDLAERETLEYMYYKVGRKKKKIVTTTCWLSEDTLYSNDNQYDFEKNGGEFLMEVLFSENLRDYWCKTYNWNGNELDEIDRLFNLFKHQQYELRVTEILGWDTGKDGKKACVTSLEELGFQCVY